MTHAANTPSQTMHDTSTDAISVFSEDALRKLRKVVVNNFLNFRHLEIEFGAGINVVVGENGVGKTNLLKIAYLLLHNQNAVHLPQGHMLDLSIFTGDLEAHESQQTHWYHLGAKQSTGQHTNQNPPTATSYVIAHGSPQNETSAMHIELVPQQFAFTQSYAIQYPHDGAGSSVKLQSLLEAITFIPAKEMLSLLKNFVALHKRFRLSYDQTYFLLTEKLMSPPLRQLSTEAQACLHKIEQAIGGKFVFKNDHVTFVKDGAVLPINLSAEGHRKFGTLAQLLETGGIDPAQKTTLFWDEPESNLNPALSKTLVEILFSLSRAGQQIVIATHDITILKWINILAQESDGVRFHNLYNTHQGIGICIETSDHMNGLLHSSIERTFTEILDDEMGLASGF